MAHPTKEQEVKMKWLEEFDRLRGIIHRLEFENLELLQAKMSASDRIVDLAEVLDRVIAHRGAMAAELERLKSIVHPVDCESIDRVLKEAG